MLINIITFLIAMLDTIYGRTRRILIALRARLTGVCAHCGETIKDPSIHVVRYMDNGTTGSCDCEPVYW